MPGFEGRVPAFFLDLQTQQRQHRAERDAAIREQQDREAASLAMLRRSAVLPADDLLWRNLPAEPPPAGGQAAASEWDRPKVFRHLNAGGDAADLPAECEGFVADYERPKADW